QLCPSSDVKSVAAREMGSDARAPLFLHGQAVRRGRRNLGGLIFSRKIGILHGNNLLGCSGPGQARLFSFRPVVPMGAAGRRMPAPVNTGGRDQIFSSPPAQKPPVPTPPPPRP